MNIQQSYREATVRGASPVQLVVRLYEQMIEDLRQAAVAIERKQIEQRTKRINHAILVVGHLQSTLDFANGKEVAQNLDNFYNVLRQNLVQAQFFPSKRALTRQITDLLVVRAAWVKVEQAENASVRTGIDPFRAADPSSDSDHVAAEWQG
jgi:flagellar secretion chaperone FliS